MKSHASRFAALAATFALSMSAASIAHAQTADYPYKPIRVIVPFGAGSVTDQLARTVGSGLAEALGQSVVVENRPGAGGNIGAGFVATSAPDGYTLLMGAASTNAINPSLYKNLRFDPLKDFVPVANVASVTNVLVVNPELKVGTVTELIKALKNGSYSYASGGAGGSQHLSAELFKSMSSTDMVHIPYKGGSEPIPDLISNRVQVMFCNLPVCLPHIKSGKLVALGVTSSKRSPLLPEVPTIAEAGLPGYSVDGWFALFAPAKVPAEIVARLHDETAKLLAKPEVQEQIRRQGAEPNQSTQAEFAKFVQAEHDKWAKVIQDANIRIE
ncbi:Bug family tripartite tricarboxylate transporter substrate binding protein [Parapusillimonas sp. JC17]|uniref:Bug family tripartite tricarboxylate transporter substrate binding protein n=1 Tax=Parapusillimonas sp. JC17 TaxID=3445768 RepID=UPI003F9EF55A